MKKLFALIAFALVLCANSGCETLERHPVATAVVIGLVAGGIALSVNHPRHLLPFASSCRQYYLNQGLNSADAGKACR